MSSLTAQPNPELNAKLEQLDALLREVKDCLIIEDGWGHRYRIANTLLIGRATDDPGLSLKIEQDARDPNAW